MSTISRNSLATAAILAIVSTTGCDSPPEYQTQGRQFGLELDSLIGENRGNIDAPASEVHVVEQSRMCPVLAGWFDDDGFHVRGEQEDDAWLRECVTLGSSGASHLDADGCLVTDAPGSAALELTAMPCDTSTFEDDRLPVVSHAVTELALVYADPTLDTILEALHPGPAPAFPPPPMVVPGDPMRIIEGTGRMVAMQPVLASGGRTVAYSDATVTGGPPTPTSTEGVGIVTVAAGDDFMLSLELAAGTITGGPILGVAASEAATLELIVGYTPCEACDDGYAEPLAAVVVVRDAQGRRLRSPDIEWTTDGDALPLGDVIEPGAVNLEPDCEDAAGSTRSSTLSATFAGLSATAAVAYTCAEPGDADGWEVDIIDDDVDNDPFGGCLCNAGPSTAASWSWLLLLPLMRRRNRGITARRRS